MRDLEARLAELGYALPAPPAPVARYVPAVRSDPWVFVSGQLPMREGELLATGPIASAVSLETGQAAARQCLLNGLAVLRAVIGAEWRLLAGIVRLGVYVYADPGFGREPEVANGASELLGEALGDAGTHARAAVGAADLPRGASVELELLARLRSTGDA